MHFIRSFSFLVASIEFLLGYFLFDYLMDNELRSFNVVALISSGIYIIVSYLFSAYNSYFKKSRVAEILQSLLYIVFLSFCFYLIDYVGVYKLKHDQFGLFSYVSILILGLLMVRLTLLNFSKGMLSSGLVSFNTLFIGNGQKALGIYNELKRINNSLGLTFLGLMKISESESKLSLPCLGEIEDLEKVVLAENIKELILAPEADEEKIIPKVVDRLEGYDVTINIIPEVHQILSGNVGVNHIVGVPVIQVNNRIISPLYAFSKRTFDIFFSLLFIIIGSPLFILCMLMVKLTSKGSIFFTQDRVGYQGKIFKIIKFRSMYMDAEHSGPQLSKLGDSRVTKWGRFMRKMRLDEIPQFINVLKGDMSVVGPRPERRFFIDQIIKKAPHYRHLFKVKPGITSLGQVKFGYAESVDEMVLRLKYDLLYVENMSMTFDLRILIYTVFIVFRGKGK